MSSTHAPAWRASRRLLAAAAVTALAATTFIVVDAMPAAAEPTTKLLDVAIDVTAGDLTFADGIATGRDGTQVVGFDEDVTVDGVALRAQLVTEDFFEDPLVGARWRIVEDGAPTQYWLSLDDSKQSYDETSCHILREEGGTFSPVNLATDSPYSCTATTGWTDDETARLVTLQVGSLVWSSLSGSIAGEGAVSLDSGYVESQNERFTLAGSPFGADSVVPPIGVGEHTEWRAEMRNTEGGEVGDDRGARMDFWYRIVNGGVSTDIWVKGYQHIYNEGIHFNRDYECTFFKGKPFEKDTVPLPLAPFECVMTADESGYLDKHLDVRFVVREREVTTISATTHRQQAQDLISEACTSESSMTSTCFYIADSTAPQPGDPVVLIDWQNNTGSVAQPFAYKKTHARALGWSITVTSKSGFDIGTSIKEEIWVALGHTGTVTDTVELDVPLVVPPGNKGRAVWTPAYVRVHGSFFVEVGGTYFRIEDMWADVADLNAGELGGSVDLQFLPADYHTETAPLAPAPVPAKASLVHASKGLIRPHVDTATHGQQVRVLVGLEHAGTWVSPSLLEGSHALGWHRVDAAGYIEITVPHGVAVGPETLVVTTAAGDVIGWHDVTITAAAPAALPPTGGGAPVAEGLTALGLLVGGAGLLVFTALRRRRGAASA